MKPWINRIMPLITKLIPLSDRLNRSMPLMSSNKSAGPCLWAATGCEDACSICYFDNCLLPSVNCLLHGICCQLFYCNQLGPETRRCHPFPPGNLFWTFSGPPPGSHENSIISSLSPRHRNSWNESQGHPKWSRMDPQIMRFQFLRKCSFCNTRNTKCLVSKLHTLRFKPGSP